MKTGRATWTNSSNFVPNLTSSGINVNFFHWRMHVDCILQSLAFLCCPVFSWWSHWLIWTFPWMTKKKKQMMKLKYIHLFNKKIQE